MDNGHSMPEEGRVSFGSVIIWFLNFFGNNIFKYSSSGKFDVENHGH